MATDSLLNKRPGLHCIQLVNHLWNIYRKCWQASQLAIRVTTRQAGTITTSCLTRPPDPPDHRKLKTGEISQNTHRPAHSTLRGGGFSQMKNRLPLTQNYMVLWINFSTHYILMIKFIWCYPFNYYLLGPIYKFAIKGDQIRSEVEQQRLIWTRPYQYVWHI